MDDTNKEHPGLTSFYYSGVEPSKLTVILKLFSKGDQIKVKLTNLEFPKTKNLV